MDRKELLGYGYMYLYGERYQSVKKYEKKFNEWKKDGMRKDTHIYEFLIKLEEEMNKYEKKKEEAHKLIGNYK